MSKLIKILVLFCITLIFLSITLISADEDYKKGVPHILLQIKQVLLGILEKLNIIAEKDTTIVVEPNITVEPPQVTVNPNITLPVKECEWETYSQEYMYEHTGNVHHPFLSGDGDSTYIPIPKNQLAKEINITKAFVFVRWTGSGNDKSIIKVNGVECLSKMGSGGYVINSLDPACFSAFVPGLNYIYIDNLEDSGHIFVKKMWLEMQVKPANC